MALGEKIVININFKELKIESVSKSFPGVQALDNVSMKIASGKVHALMGENGAGKSTLIKILAGAYSKDSGDISFDENKLNIRNPNDSLNYGIKVVYQEISLISEFSVAENIFLDNFPTNNLGIINWNKLYKDTEELFNRIGFDLNPKSKISDLSISQQQMVEIARAVFKNASLVIMDEPTSSLTPNEIDKLFTVIKNLKQNNIAILYVTHKIDEIFQIADEVTVLRDGQHISNKLISESSEETIIKDMVGRTVNATFERPVDISSAKTVMKVKQISSKNKINNVSFDLHEGEILGFFGLMGAGRTELAKAILDTIRLLKGM